MNKKRILVAEDDISSAKLLERILESAGYEVILAEDGKKALTKFSENPFQVVVSDLNMPHLSGDKLIQELKKTNYHPIIIVQTALDEAATVINIMKKGVYDYIIKPINPDDLLHKVQKAFEIAEFRDLKRNIEKEYEIKLDRQLSWNHWKENIYTRDRERFDKTLFHNMKTIFSQGAGFGGLLSALPLITNQPKDEKDNYIIDKNFMSLILENMEMAKKALLAFSEIDNLLHTNYELTKIPVSDIFSLISDIIQDFHQLASLKAQNIQLSISKEQFENSYIIIHPQLFKKALHEIILNALKFSEEKSSILVILSVVKHIFLLSILSSPMIDKNKQKGIPEQAKNLVFEPFFRLNETVDERFDTLDYGLGLTFVEKIIHKFNGKISASNLSSHLKLGKPSEEIRVKIEIEIPLV